MLCVTQPELQQEANVLMGKLCYVEGEYSEALTHFNHVNLDDMQLNSAPIYRLAMIAEAYATKGECAHIHTCTLSWIL